jgi:hypothetical protein
MEQGNQLSIACQRAQNGREGQFPFRLRETFISAEECALVQNYALEHCFIVPSSHIDK